MTRDEAERLARTRFAVLSALRASGVAIMLIGLLIWHTDLLQAGGSVPVGAAIFFAGLIESLFVPKLLAARWRTPRD